MYLLTCVDRFTRWPEAVPIPDISAETVAKAFVSRWVAVFGAPATVTTDRGRQFESTLFQSLSNILGCKRTRTTSYHPAANGLVERLHRQLKASLKAHNNQRWTETLPIVLLGIRTAVKADIGCSAAELVFGTTVTLPGQFVAPSMSPTDWDPSDYVQRLRRHMTHVQPTPPRPQHKTTHIPPALSTCTHVFVRVDAVKKPLQPPYNGPYRVIKRTAKFFFLEINGKQDSVSIDRLKAAFLEPLVVIPKDAPPPRPTPLQPPKPTATLPTVDERPQPRTTRSGRHVHWPSRYVQFLDFG